MKSPNDPEFTAWTRRQFTKIAAIGGGTALLSPWWQRGALAQQGPGTHPFAKRGTEGELDALAKSSPHLHMICADALAHLKYAFTVVASGKHAGKGHEFADLCRPFVAGRRQRTRAAYQKGANELLAAPQETRDAHFSHYAKVAPAVFLSTKLEAQLRPPKPIKPATLDELKALSLPSSSVSDHSDVAEETKAAAKDSLAKKAHENNLAEGRKWKQLEFFIREVKCIENTGGLFEGDDEISMGGVIVGTTGAMKKIKQFRVKDGFDTDSDANTKKYKHGKSFALFDIHPDVALPHEYVVTMAMAELDSGGFGDFIEGLWKKVKEYVTAALAAAGGALAGAVSLSWIPGIGTAIGAVIGAFIGWFVKLFHNDDDIVGLKTRTLRLYHATKSYYDKLDLTTPNGMPVTMDFIDEGHYRVTGGWRLVRS